MRPRILPSQSILKSLRYNEEKVTEKKAECILAANFLKDVEKLSFSDKQLRFERRQQLNERVTTSQHISLNFDPSDKLSNENMQEIANIYMRELGFERQPYLVYRHHDAGHPHCHIVSTHVQRNGDPIIQYKIGENQSEKARKFIELKFDLMTKEKKQQRREQAQKINGIQKVVYGQKTTTRAISDVVQYVTEQYKCTSLEELNVALRLYNVEAYRGKENTKLYQNRGLLYRILDEHGKYIGVPLKASFFDFKPTLDNLEKKFEVNRAHIREKDLTLHTEAPVMWHLFHHPNNLKKFTESLQADRVLMQLQHDRKGVLTRVNFINFKTKCVHRGEDLDEKCGIKAIQQLIEQDKARQEELARNPQQQRDQDRSRDLDQGLEL